MSGRGQGRRGRGGRGAKRSTEQFEKKNASKTQAAEPAAPLPGGFKSMKAKWISFYENEQKAQESSKPARPMSTDSSDAATRSAAASEPLGSTPMPSAPHGAPEALRKPHATGGFDAQGKGLENVGAVMPHSRGLQSSEDQKKPDSKSQLSAVAAALEAGAPDPKRQKRLAAASDGKEATTASEPMHTSLPGDGDAQKSQEAPAAADGRQPGRVAADLNASSSAGVPAAPGNQSGSASLVQGPTAKKLPQAAKAKPESGRVAAIHDAAASYAAASKAHRSMQEPMSPKKPGSAAGSMVPVTASAADRVKAEKSKALVAASRASESQVDAKQPASKTKQEEPMTTKAESVSDLAPGPVKDLPQPKPEGTIKKDPMASSAPSAAAAGQPERPPQEASSAPRKAEQPKAEIKQEAKEPSGATAVPKQGPEAKEHRGPGPKDKTQGESVTEAVPKQQKQKAHKAKQGPPGILGGPQSQPRSLPTPASEQPAQALSGAQGQKTGQQGTANAPSDTESRPQADKARAEAKAAPGAAGEDRQKEAGAKEQSKEAKEQQQLVQTSAREVSAPAHSAQDQARSSLAAAAEEASRQKGSDVSSLERSPDMPQQARQQLPQPENELAATAPPARETVKQEGGEHQHAPQQATKLESACAPEGSCSGQLAPVEFLGEGSSSSQQLGQVNLAQYDSYRALWAGLRKDYAQALPEGPGLRLVYEDGEGDLVLLQPDEPWPAFLAAARRVIISCQ